MPDITKKGRGRPIKEGGKMLTYGIRLDTDLIEQLDIIAAREKDKTGYNIDRSDIIRRFLSEGVKRYKGEDKNIV